MSRLPTPGSDDNVWGEVLNDYLSVSHNTDGTLKGGTVGNGNLKSGSVTTSVIADAAVTSAKLSDNYVPMSAVGAPNGVAQLDATGVVPTGQLPPATAVSDASVTTKGILQLTGDLGGTATSPTVPALVNKVDTSSVGSANGVASLDGSTHVPVAQLPAATALAEGIVQLAGDLSGTAVSPTVPGLTNKVDTAALGAANGVATLDGSGVLTAAQSPLRVLPYSAGGPLSVKTGSIRLYNDSAGAWTIKSVRASVGTAPTGASVIVDIKINGTTIFTTQANRPAIVAGSNTSGSVTNMDVTNIPSGSYITVDVAQVGSTVAGSDLCVQIGVR